MKTSRIGMGVLALLAWLAGAPCMAQATEWPNRQVRFIVAQAPGSSADGSARQIAAALAAIWKQPVVVENKAGANGIIGMSAVQQAPPDGYTIGYAAPGNMTVNQFIYKEIPFDPLKDFTPVTQMTSIPFALVVNGKLPVKTVPELIAYIKNKPQGVNYSSAGVGNVGHLAAELFATRAGVKLYHIPNKGDSPALLDVASGTTDFMFLPLPGAMATIRSGNVRLIAVGGRQRIDAFSDVPTLDESGLKGMYVEGWSGVVAPPGLPAGIARKIQADFSKALAEKSVVGYLRTSSPLAVGSTAEQFKSFMDDEAAKWSGVIDSIGLRNSH